MPVVVREASVYVVNGEGGRERVTSNAIDAIKFQVQMGQREMTADVFEEARNTLPFVHFQIRDIGHDLRIEVPLVTWEEVEALKAVPGVWDEKRKCWCYPQKAKVRITIESVE